MLVDEIARVCHEANRGLQAAQNDPGIAVSPTWDDESDELRASVVSGVEAALAGATPEQLHQGWCDIKMAEGWAWGPVKDVEQKTHPCLVSHGELPESHRVKDRLFHSIVRALATSDVDELGSATDGTGHSVILQGVGRQTTISIDDMRLRNVEAASVQTEAGTPMQRVTATFLTDRAYVLPIAAADQ